MINNTHKHSVQPPLRLGGVRILEFWVLGGGQNSFDFKGLVYSVGGVGGGGGECSFSILCQD